MPGPGFIWRLQTEDGNATAVLAVRRWFGQMAEAYAALRPGASGRLT